MVAIQQFATSLLTLSSLYKSGQQGASPYRRRHERIGAVTELDGQAPGAVFRSTQRNIASPAALSAASAEHFLSHAWHCW